jgi:hypothetical protein
MRVSFVEHKPQITIEAKVGFFFLSFILLLSVSLSPFSEPRFSLCLFKNLFGFSCPGCGMGRSFIFLGHGQISNAFYMNPISFLAFPMVLFFWINIILSITLKKEMEIRINSIEKWMVIGLLAIFETGVWIFNLII